MLKKFKEFALKGNIIDLAVAVIIGTAFGKIVASFVSDIIMPLLSIFTGKIKFENLFIALDGKTYETIEAAQTAGASTLNYGMFIISVIDFFIIAISIFITLGQLNKLAAKLANKKPEAAPAVKNCPFCKTSIHIDASRCPNCTSDIDKAEKLEELENNKGE